MNDRLAQYALLKHLGEERLVKLFPYLERRRVEAGRTLFHCGEEASEMMLVVEGSIRVEVEGRSLGTLGEGDTLGGLSVLVVGKRECTAVCEENTQLLVLTREACLRLRTDLPDVALTLQEAIMRGFVGAMRAFLPSVVRSGAELA